VGFQIFLMVRNDQVRLQGNDLANAGVLRAADFRDGLHGVVRVPVNTCVIGTVRNNDSLSLFPLTSTSL
jgi:hypothetical protein